MSGNQNLYSTQGLTLALTGAGAVPSALDDNFAAGTYQRGGVSYATPDLQPGWTFSRASQGYAQTVAGALTSFNSGVARITDQGLLIEPAATNLVPFSNDLSNTTNWPPAFATQTGGQADPAGGTTAISLSDIVSVVQTHVITAATTFTVVLSTSYMASMFAKQGTGRYTQMLFSSAVMGTGYANFDLQTGTVSLSAAGTSTGFAVGVVALANGWYRLWMKADCIAGGSAGFPMPRLADSGSSARGAGYAVVTPTANFFYGPQFEVTPATGLPSSYIATNSTTPVTRPADALTQTFAGAPANSTITYQPSGSVVTPNPTSPINLGSSSAGAWVGGYIKRVLIK